MSIKREYHFDQVGDKDMYLLHHEEIESLAKNIPGVKRIRFFMTFGQSYLTHMKCLENVGMLSTTPIDYEGQLFSLYFPFAPLLGLLLVVGLVWLFFRFYRKGPGQKKVFFPLVAAGFLGILGFSLWLRQYGQPYYLWMDVVPLCVLSWQVLLLWGIPWVSARRRQRSLPPLQT